MNLDYLKEVLSKEMENLSKSPYLARVLEPGFADKRLYSIYMSETYHYTKHNAKNQALVATRYEDLNPRYMKFCLKHALEEVGHELMAFHDLKSLGEGITLEDLPAPLSSTETLIGYLYHASTKFNPVARLGYSFWAERVYEYMQPLLNLMGEGLKIENKSMTFFNEHSDIDVKHAEEVDKAIEQFAKTEDDWKSIEEVMKTSLKLTSKMLDEVFEEFIKVKAGEESRYPFLSKILV